MAPIVTRVGLSVPQLGPGISGPLVRDFCEAAEESGFTSLWVQEHLFHPCDSSSAYAGIAGQAPPDVYRSCLGSTELLTAAACHTRTARIGTSVLVGGYHRPVELAQRLATVDVISGGRLVVGLGAGWSDEEHQQMDVDPRRRGRRLTELVHALRACWEPDPVAFHGEHFDVPRSYVSPKPVQAQIPLIAGTSSRAGLRRTAEVFDGWNPAGVPVSVVQRVLGELEALRPPGRRPLTVWPRLFPQPPNGAPALDRMFEEVRASREAGFEEVIIDAHFWGEITQPSDWLTVVEHMVPALATAAA